MLTEQLEHAMHAFAACVDADLNPTLTAVRTPYNGKAEYDVVIGGRGNVGVLHEDLEKTLRIAADHGGRAFLDGHDGQLAIVWPLSQDDNPGPVGDDGPSPAEAERVAARGRRRKKSIPTSGGDDA